MLLTFQTTELIYILTVKLTKHELFGYIPFGNFQSYNAMLRSTT